jgi:frataxin
MVDKAFNMLLNKMECLSDTVNEQDGGISFSINNIGEYMFNRQPTSKQLWASSPITGPCRFNIKEDQWIHYKNNLSLSKYLDMEISQIKKQA